MPSPLLIIGAGGVGREIAATLRNSAFSAYRIKGFVDDGLAAGTLVHSLPVVGNLEWLLQQSEPYAVVIAIGNPKIRATILEQLKDCSFEFPAIIHPNVRIHDTDRVHIGPGCYLADGCILTTDITLEAFCFLNTACTLQHDTYVERNSVLMPGVRITGGARIGTGTYIAANCVITTSATVAPHSVITRSIR
jgi:sugar O-acyltransferase (sialic acid O-acetyltransferase NeuD family)